MKTATLLMLMILLLSTSAQAKIIACANKCFELQENQLSTIKGMLYELGQKQKPQIKKSFLPHIAKTIVWMDKIHKQKKIYNLNNLQKDDRAKLISTSVDFIIRILSGEYPRINAQQTIIRWTHLGKKIIAKYEKKTIKYQLEIKKE